MATTGLIALLVAVWAAAAGAVTLDASALEVDLPLETKLPATAVSAHQDTAHSFSQSATEIQKANAAKRQEEVARMKEGFNKHNDAAQVDIAQQATEERATLENEAADQGTLRKVRDLNHASYMLGVLNFAATVSMTEALVEALADSNFTASLDQFRKEIQKSGAQYSSGASKKINNVMEASRTTSDSELVAVLGEFFGMQARMLASHRREAEASAKKIQLAMPKHLTESLSPLKDILAPFQNIDVSFDASSMKNTGPGHYCDQVSTIMTNVSFYDTNLRLVKQALNATAKLAPMFVANNTKKPMTPAVAGHFQDLVSLGFMETIVLEDVSGGIKSKLGPIIASRLNCTWSSGATRGRSLLAVVALAAAWLSSLF